MHRVEDRSSRLRELGLSAGSVGAGGCWGAGRDRGRVGARGGEERAGR